MPPRQVPADRPSGLADMANTAKPATPQSPAEPASEPPVAPAGGTKPVRDARRRLLRSMREELLPVVEAIVGHTQMLRNDAADRPADMLQDVEKLLDCTTDLYRFIKRDIRHTWPEVKTDSFDERLKQVRHDVGNRLNHALGYCQFLIMDERDKFFGAFVEDLETIQRFCKQCEGLLVGYRSVSAQESKGAGRDVASHAVEVVPLDARGASDVLIGPASILVVDDSAHTCELLAKFLERQSHEVCTSADGESALQLLVQRHFDLILLDFMMPGMTGFEVLKRLKSSERLRHTPVIMISALDAVEDMIPCIESGADDYLVKPVDFALLKARVNSSLERIRLREREFGQFFSPEIARFVMRNPEVVREGRDADVTVLFCDIRGFSRISENLGPSDTVRWLSDVMDQFTQCVRKHRGVPVNYIGDELMAMWGAPEDVENHAELACRAAYEILARLPGINEKWRAVVKDDTDVGIGINSGQARVGDTGAGHKFNYGPLGGNVNLASRVQGATRYLQTRLMITGGTHGQLKNRFPARRLCKVRVNNISEPVELYELLPEDDPRMERLRERYMAALQHAENQELPQAAAVLGELLVGDPHDGPSLLLMSRVVDALHRRDRFEPVWELPGK